MSQILVFEIWLIRPRVAMQNAVISVFVSTPVREHISKTTTVTVVRSSSGGVETYYALPVFSQSTNQSEIFLVIEVIERVSSELVYDAMFSRNRPSPATRVYGLCSKWLTRKQHWGGEVWCLLECLYHSPHLSLTDETDLVSSKLSAPWLVAATANWSLHSCQFAGAATTHKAPS